MGLRVGHGTKMEKDPALVPSSHADSLGELLNLPVLPLPVRKKEVIMLSFCLVYLDCDYLGVGNHLLLSGCAGNLNSQRVREGRTGAVLF